MAQWANEYKAKNTDSAAVKLEKQEQLLFDATELISRAMEQQGVSKTELAKRIGKSKAYVTQVLGGQTNMTLRTLSDLAAALGYDVELGGINLQTSQTVQVGRWNGPTKMDVVYGQLQEAVTQLAPAPALPVPVVGKRYVFEEVA
ncbi:MAG TPA: helix-turn-helix transcriptional regulator [Candidatus Acidoferrum sp.]